MTPTTGPTDLDADLTRYAQQAQADVFAHAVDIDSGRELGRHADASVVTASVFKVPILLEYVRQIDEGRIRPTDRVRITAANRTVGPTGLSVFTDDTDWSVRDVATSMITVSDNAATDVLAGLVGLDRVNATLRSLGLPRTVVEHDCRGLFATMAQDYGVDDDDEIDALMRKYPDRVPDLQVCDPLRTCRSTPRESTDLLRRIWTDEVASAAGCAEARRILGLQVWSHRLSSGFSENGTTVSGKTGTIGVVRNEIGVVERPGGQRFAVAVFTRAHTFAERDPRGDALIGQVGRALVDALGTG